MRGRNKGVLTYIQGISPKLNVIVQMELEFTNEDITVQHVCYYATETSAQFQSSLIVISFVCLFFFCTRL